MVNQMRVIAITLTILLISSAAVAQTGGVSLKPILKPGQEARYRLTGEVDTEITAAGAGGLSGTQSRELVAMVLLRAGVAAPQVAAQSATVTTAVAGPGAPYSRETFAADTSTASQDLVYYEAVIEMLDASLKVNGAETSVIFQNGVGQKIEFALDANGQVVKCSLPVAAAKAGLADLLFSLFGWAPAAPLKVGQRWSNSGSDSLTGNYGYISAAALSDAPKAAKVTYRLASLDGGLGTIEGTIALNQQDATQLEIPAAQTKVNLIASGSGTTRIEYDVTTNRIASAVSESTLKGRVVNIAPTREGEKMQPREGVLVETAKFSVKLLQ